MPLPKNPFGALRNQALAVVRPEELDWKSLPPAEIQRIFHELQVHQAELEIQNEELRRTQTELEKVRDEFSDLYNKAPVGYVTVDNTGMILNANQTIADMLQVTRSQILMTPFANIVHLDDKDTYYSRFRAFFQKSSSRKWVLRLKRADKGNFPAELQGAPTSPGSNTCRIVISDVTERVQSDMTLRRQDTLFRMIADNVADLILTLSQDGTIQYISPSASLLLGRDSADLVGRERAEFIHPDDQYAFRTLLQSPWTPGEQNQLVFRTKHKNGRDVWMESKIRRANTNDLGAASNTIINTNLNSSTNPFFLCAERDVTERKHAELKMQRITAALESTSEAIYISDHNHQEIFSNSAYNSLCGQSRLRFDESDPLFSPRRSETPDPDRRISKPPLELVQNLELSRHIASIIDRGGSWSGEVDLLSDRILVPVRLQANTVKDPSGSPLGFVIILSDIRVKRQQEDRLRQLLDDLRTANTRIMAQANDLKIERDKTEAASEARGLFIASVVHEIRSPMLSVIGHAEAIAEHAFPPEEIPPAIQAILRGSEHILQVVNDFLDVSRMESGQLKPDCKPTLLREIVEDCLQVIRLPSHKNTVEICELWDEPLFDVVNLDPLRVRQILLNLLGNAAKFTAGGKITLEIGPCLPVKNTDDPDSPHLLKFQVHDTGVGMSEQQLNQLFLPYRQVHDASAFSQRGSGLGLTIARNLARIHGGDLTATSTPGQGSHFQFTIRVTIPQSALTLNNQSNSDIPANAAPNPLVIPQNPSPETPSSLSTTTSNQIRTTQNDNAPTQSSDERTLLLTRGLSQRSILIAEDGKDNQRVLKFMLTKAGADVVLADNGREAVEFALMRLSENRPFDAIVMDVHMPILDGLSATRQLRNSGYTLPILALTANAMIRDRELALQAGCDDFASKPIRRDELIRQILKVLNVPDGRLSADPQPDLP